MTYYDTGKEGVAGGGTENFKIPDHRWNAGAETERNPLPVVRIALCQTRIHVTFSTQLHNVYSAQCLTLPHSKGALLTSLFREMEN